MKILGFQSGHDVSYCVLENGIPVIHDELERFTRIKEPMGDGLKMALEHCPPEILKDIGYFSLGNYGMFSPNGISKWGAKGSGVSWNLGCYDESCVTKMNSLIDKNNGGFYQIGHHLSHASNAFFTSEHKESLIITIDGGGWEDDKTPTAFTISIGSDNKITPVEIFPINQINFGYIWNHCTAFVFGLSAGYPKGNQCGSVMAMATIGEPKYKHLFNVTGNGIDYEMLKNIASTSEQEKYNVAASLQKFTEEQVVNIIQPYIEKYKLKNICFSGGVALNCVMMGRIREIFPNIKDIFIDPVPYDAGLSLGSARYLWHCIMDNPRIYNTPANQTSYLGRTYKNINDIESLLLEYKNIFTMRTTDEEVLNMLKDGKIVSVFGGSSESGRRALGNRSILADPRNPNMRDIINKKVKHRQWYRPFAPSIIREAVSEWFEQDVSSPYMSFAIKFRDNKAKQVPAVVHYDNTGRLQTVEKTQNLWYYNFLKKWEGISGVPILLNTSFNDREPIVETPKHAIDCFTRTNIDHLYFYDFGILLSKKEK